MSLHSQLMDDMKTAMKAGEKQRVATLRMLMAQLKDVRIAKQEELTEDEETSVLLSAAKKRKEAAEAFEKGGRTELAEQEQAELEVISAYLPKQMSDDEVATIVDRVIQESGASSMKDMGGVMKAAMAVLKGKADGKKVQEIVRGRLA